MYEYWIHVFVLIALLFTHCSFAAAGDATTMPTLTVKSDTTCEINPNLFGQFFERPSWGGETGPECAYIPEPPYLPTEVVEKLRAMRIPIVRFPGGTDHDYMDWTDMIDNAPGRENPKRPVSVGKRGDEVTNRFGYDEYFVLAKELGWETILPVNLRDATHKVKTVEEAALHAAGLVAYCNAKPGAKLPEGMPDWGAVRAKNGRPEPYNVKWFQIGNETYWFYPPKKEERAALGLETQDDLNRWYRDCVVAIADAMRAVDPEIKFIVDGPQDDLHYWGEEKLSVFRFLANDPEIKKRVELLSVHDYAPTGYGNLKKNGEKVERDTLDIESLWYAMISIPGTIDENGFNTACDAFRDVEKLGYKVACTEWNWNGWSFESRYPQAKGKLTEGLPSALGAAGFLHGLMRSGNRVELATQSMLLGCSWNITAIRVDPDGKREPFYFPQGLVSRLYGPHHGAKLHKTETANWPTMEQPYQLVGWFPKPPKLALIDPLVTSNKKAVFVHVINRHWSDDLTVRVDLSALGGIPAQEATLHIITGDPTAHANTGNAADLESRVVEIDGSTFDLTLPKRSVSVLVVNRSPRK